MLYLLIFVPISLVLEYLVKVPPLWVFGSAVVAIIPLAVLIQQATEQIANRSDPAVGSLLNVTFGNAAELILGLFVLSSGQFFVVKGQITGSIIGNSLLVLGIAILIGTWRRQNLKFNRDQAGLLSTLLLLTLIGLTLPAIFDYTERTVDNVTNTGSLDEALSLAVSIVLILLYIGNLIYTLVTHQDQFSVEQGEAQTRVAHQRQIWSMYKSLGILVAATAVTAWESEIVSNALTTSAKSIGVTDFFMGVVVLALIGNAAEFVSCIYFARAGNMPVALSISVGGTVQVALFVAPLLVIISYFLGKPMNLVFTSPLELIALFSVAFSVNTIAKDGAVTWFEGAFLVGIYLLLTFAFFFITVP